MGLGNPSCKNLLAMEIIVAICSMLRAVVPYSTGSLQNLRPVALYFSVSLWDFRAVVLYSSGSLWNLRPVAPYSTVNLQDLRAVAPYTSGSLWYLRAVDPYASESLQELRAADPYFSGIYRIWELWFYTSQWSPEDLSNTKY